jgi:hypothetical protein
MLEESALRQLYLEEQRSIRAIAASLQVPTRVVYDGLMRYHIPRRTGGFQQVRAANAAAPFDAATLRQWYEVEGRTIRTIAALAHVSTRTVYDALRRYHIPRRARWHRQPAPLAIPFADGMLDAETLRAMYQDEGHTIATIARIAHSSPSRIRSALIRYNIKRRRRGRPTGQPVMDD